MSKHAQEIEAARRAYVDALANKPWEAKARYFALQAAVERAKEATR
jgi:hypothetical protein